MDNENAAGAADTSVSTDAGASSNESVAEDFDFRSPAEIETSRQQEESTVDTTVDEDEGEEEADADADADTDETSDSTTQTTQDSDTTTDAPSQEQEQSQEVQSIVQEAKKLEIKLPTDEFGNLDVNALPQFIEDVQAAAEAKAEEVINRRVYMADELEKVETAYPDLAKNADRMKIVQDLRMADVLNGGKGDLLEIANKYMTDRGEAVQQGKESQKQSIRRQKSARLETATRTGAKGDSARLQRLTETAFGNNASRAQREDARIARIRMLRDSGKL